MAEAKYDTKYNELKQELDDLKAALDKSLFQSLRYNILRDDMSDFVNVSMHFQNFESLFISILDKVTMILGYGYNWVGRAMLVTEKKRMRKFGSVF